MGLACLGAVVLINFVKCKHQAQPEAGRIAIVFPLYYSAWSLLRLNRYLAMNRNLDNADVFVMNSNQLIDTQARSIAQGLGFEYQLRSNAGGGEGSLWFFQQLCLLNGREFAYLIYLEETCEPLVENWLVKILSGLDEHTWVNGWDWNFRGKNRGSATPVRIGRGWRKAWAYATADKGHPMNAITNQVVWDCPGFRHELLAVDFRIFMQLVIPSPEAPPWCELAPGAYGRAMERMYWQRSPGEPDPPNLQFQCFLLGSRLPSVANRHFFQFHELNRTLVGDVSFGDSHGFEYSSTRRVIVGVFNRCKSILKFLLLHTLLERKVSRSASDL